MSLVFLAAFLAGAAVIVVLMTIKQKRNVLRNNNNVSGHSAAESPLVPFPNSPHDGSSSL
jgi:hypothetical protein